jgi:hypothetical protein
MIIGWKNKSREYRINFCGRQVVHLGQGPANLREVRMNDRATFIPDQFAAAHGSCFDADGNIFVVEWVEIGRVTKLRKV